MKLLAIFASLTVLALGCPSRRAATHPSILLISIDSLRADHLGSYGYGRSTSPFLDSLAAGGVRFSDFQSLSPWTLPSHATMLSGLHELEHGVVEMDRALGGDVRLLAELFRDRGYRTAGVVTGFFVSRKFGFARGFDFFDDFDVQQGEDWRGIKPLGEQAIDRALQWIGRESDKPFFVFLHLFDVHWPYDPPAPQRDLFPANPAADPGRYRGYFHYPEHPLSREQIDHLVARYDGSIRYVDDQLARLDRELRARGLDFVTVVTADHGEELFDHGSWGHAHTLYREQLWIPWIVHGPGVPKGKVVTGAADMTDVPPTLLDIAGLPHDPTHRGTSRRPAWSGGAVSAASARARVSTTSRLHSLVLARHEGDEKLIVDVRRGRTELFDVGVDPAETRNLSAAEPSRLADREVALRREVAGRLRAVAHLDWRSLAPATLRLESDGVFVWLDGATLAPGFPASLVVPLSRDGSLAFRLFPNDARFQVRLEGAAPPILSAAGARLIGSENGLSLDDPAFVSGAPSAPPTGAVRVTVDRESGQNPTVTLTEAQRELLRSLGYVSP